MQGKKHRFMRSGMRVPGIAGAIMVGALAVGALSVGGVMMGGSFVPSAMAFPAFPLEQAGGVQQGTARAGGAPVEPVGWVCRQNRCNWDPNFHGRVPSYARSWGPPRNSSCRWERVRDKHGDWRWREMCRRR